MENNLERSKIRAEFPAIVSPCPTMKFSNWWNIRTLYPSQAGEFPKTSRRGDMRWLGVKINPGACCLILILIKHWSLWF